MTEQDDTLIREHCRRVLGEAFSVAMACVGPETRADLSKMLLRTLGILGRSSLSCELDVRRTEMAAALGRLADVVGSARAASSDVEFVDS